MLKKIILLLVILLSLSSCWTNNLEQKGIKEKNTVDNSIKKVEKKWLWAIWETGKITVSSWFTK